MLKNNSGNSLQKIVIKRIATVIVKIRQVQFCGSQCSSDFDEYLHSYLRLMLYFASARLSKELNLSCIRAKSRIFRTHYIRV